MKRQILIVAAGLMLLAGASNAQAFELFRGRHLGHGCCAAEVSCCEEAPTCCEPAPVCCEPAPTCCEEEISCCEAEPCCRPGLLARLHARKAQWWSNFKHRHFHKHSCCGGCEVAYEAPSCGCGH